MASPDAFDTHQWKSEFASTRSGRNSPNIFAKVRRKLLLTPPVRNARSPRLTDEELDALTGDLPYETNYTYAYSKIYDPSLPDHWEVPNLAGGPSPRYLAEQEHWSAASLGRQLFYLLRFPVVLLIHVITYILEAFYHLVKITTFTFWDYLVYFIRTCKSRFEAYLDHRRRTALIRNRQDPLKVKAIRFLTRVWEFVTYIVLFPTRLFAKNNGVEQYNYTSIRGQLENERASRMLTRSQALAKSRRIDGLSQSPARNTPSNTTNITTRIKAKVFSSGASPAVSSNPTASNVTSTRNVRERSVTPRYVSNRTSTRNTRQAFQDHEYTPEVVADTPLSSYGLRSRRISHLNTPEPTFDIGHVAATSTPVSFRRPIDGDQTVNNQVVSHLQTLITYIGYFILMPFFASKYIWLTIFDHAKSTYMKLTNYQPEAMEPIYVRPANEPAPDAAAAIAALAYIPLHVRILNFVKSSLSTVKNAVVGLVALILGGTQEFAYYAAGLLRGIGGGIASAVRTPWSKRFTLCNILGLLLALLLAFFLIGFLTSENTEIRANNIKIEAQKEKLAHPETPFYLSAFNHGKKSVQLVYEYIIDLVFTAFNLLKPAVASISSIPIAVWETLKTAIFTVWEYVLWIVAGAANSIISLLSVVGTIAKNVWEYLIAAFWSSEEKAKEIYESGSVKTQEYMSSMEKNVKESVSGAYNTASTSVYHYIKLGVAYITDFASSVASFFIDNTKAVNNVLYDSFLEPIFAFFHNFKAKDFFKPVVASFNYLWNLVGYGAESIVWILGRIWATLLYIITYPIGLLTSAWIHISQYAPEDVVQVIPIPQAITPDPILETLQKEVELEDEEKEIVIKPIPAPQPIPVPNQQPVVIHQTNVVETVDKDAIIKEVTEKLRAELSAQFHQELSTKFEANYNELIQKLKVENTNIQIDNAHLEGLIRQMIYEYDTDKTGQVDFALESSGGAVVSTRCSETYKSYTRLEKFWDIPIYYHHYSPRVVIQRNSKSLFPGECWCFKESRGYIAVELSHFIDVSSISYEHIGKEVAPEGNRSSAPKGVLVWAYKQIDDLNSRVLIGDYTYDLNQPPLQFFIAKHKPDFPVKFVELEVTSNYGAAYTCLYRLRVHGKMVKV